MFVSSLPYIRKKIGQDGKYVIKEKTMLIVILWD